MSVKQTKQQRIESLEGRLSGVLRPVRPSEDFVRHIRGRITLAPTRVVIDRLHDTRFLLLVLGGVLSFLLLFITGTRAIFYLIGRK